MAARTCSSWVVLVAVLGVAASAVALAAGCVTGATPDCSSPDAGCGPGAEGGPGDGQADVVVAVDAPVDTGSVDAGFDSGDTGQQPGTDASDAAPDVSDASTVDGDATTE